MVRLLVKQFEECLIYNSCLNKAYEHFLLNRAFVKLQSCSMHSLKQNGHGCRATLLDIYIYIFSPTGYKLP